MDREKHELVDEIVSRILDNPLEIAFYLLDQNQILKDKNIELAKMVVYGVPKSPKKYAEYHSINKEDFK